MLISDWSSDVCSSDLLEPACRPAAPTAALFLFPIFPQQRGEFRDVDVAGFVRIDAKHRPRAHDDLLDHRSHGPARGPLARAEGIALGLVDHREHDRSEEHTSELQSLMHISHAVFCLKKKK